MGMKPSLIVPCYHDRLRMAFLECVGGGGSYFAAGVCWEILLKVSGGANEIQWPSADSKTSIEKPDRVKMSKPRGLYLFRSFDWEPDTIQDVSGGPSTAVWGKAHVY